MRHGEEKFDKKYYKRFFDQYSESEFSRYVSWAKGWIKFLDGYVDIKNGRGKKLIEIGSSLGYFSKVFKDRGFDVSGSDISSYIIKKAGMIQKDIKFFVLNIEDKIKMNKKYDYVVAFEVLEHLKNPQKALININNILNKNGTLIFSTPFPTKRSLSDPTHINVHGEKWWLEAGKKAGFKNRRVIYGTFIPYLYRLSGIFSIGFPIKTDIPYVNSTSFYIFKK